MTRVPRGRLRLVAGAALAATLIGGGMMATASTIASDGAVAEAPVVPATPAVPAMPSAMTPGPLIRAVPVLRSTPKPPLALAAVDARPVPPESPARLSDAVTVVREDKLSVEEREAIREARQAAADARREAAEARVEALQEAAEARREGEQARREAVQVRAEAKRAAASARRHEFSAATQARDVEIRRAFAERDRALRDIPRLVEASLARARSRMAERCAAGGVMMPANADFGTLATCGEHLERTIRVALTSARAAIAASTELSTEQRQNALKGLDSAIAELGREPARR